jgi:hypothetical protein
MAVTVGQNVGQATTLPENVASTVQFLDPFTELQTRTLVDEARQAAQKRIDIPQQKIAGFTPEQEEAFRIARGAQGEAGLGGFRPFITEAQRLAGLGAEQLTGTVDPVTGLRTPGQAGVVDEALRETRRALDPTKRAIEFAERGIGAFDPSQIKQFQDPYQQEVIDAQLASIDRQRDIASQGIAAQAAQAGAFGGSRYGIQQAELERNAAEQRQRMESQLLSQGFQQAQAAALAENARVAEAQRGVADLLGNLGAQYGQIGGQLSGIGAQKGNIAAGLGSLAQQQAGLGGASRALTAEDIGLLAQTGGIQKQQAQALLDAKQQADVQQAYEPFQRVSFISDILRGTPSGSQTLSVSASPLPNPFTQSLGTGLAAAGLFAPKRNKTVGT